MIRLCTTTLAALVLFCLSATVSARPTDARLTRRGLVCMLGLAGVSAVGGVGQSIDFDPTTWNGEASGLEISRAKRSRLVRMLDGYVSAIPGVAANTLVAVAMDAVAEYVGVVDGVDPTSASYLDTVIKANMLLIGKITVAALVPSAGNASLDAADFQNIRRAPFWSTVDMAVKAPVIEELIFRLLPSRLVGRGWKVGIPTNLLFALSHNVTDHGFSFEKIPITQFIGGMYYWYLIREKGYDHAVLAHAANNNAFLVGIWFDARFP